MENTLDAARSIMATTVACWEHLVASVPPDVLERRSVPCRPRGLMQVFIPGTGPWRCEFSDHDVEARAPRA